MAFNPLKSYDIRKLVPLINGIPVQGLGSGSPISIEFPESWTTQIGAGGAHTRSRNNDSSADLTLSLQQTSLTNQQLNILAELDNLTGNSTFAFLLKDTLGNDLLFAPQAYVTQRPAMSYGKDSGDREWTIKLCNVTGAALGTPNT